MYTVVAERPTVLWFCRKYKNKDASFYNAPVLGLFVCYLTNCAAQGANIKFSMAVEVMLRCVLRGLAFPQLPCRRRLRRNIFLRKP